jgi:mycothiol synthase
VAVARLRWQHVLSPGDAVEIGALLETAAGVDGGQQASEDVRLQLRPGAEIRGSVVTAHLPDPAGTGGAASLAGFGHLGPPAPTRQAELLVHPHHRRRGVGSQLLDAMLAASPGTTGRLSVWAHRNGVAAAALARRFGFTRQRVLLQLRRNLDGTNPPPDAALPPGVRLRPFVPGSDERDWLALNRLAFADHPEQGRWTQADLRARQAEPWFDPAGFLLAESSGGLAGFHWTKIHSEMSPALVGEVYVIGVAPAWRGSGLGRGLLAAGLRHLADRGAQSVILYVEEDNAPAVRLYTGLGFDIFSRDVTYVRPMYGATHYRKFETG